MASITNGINSSVSRNPAAMLWYVVPTVTVLLYGIGRAFRYVLAGD